MCFADPLKNYFSENFQDFLSFHKLFPEWRDCYLEMFTIDTLSMQRKKRFFIQTRFHNSLSVSLEKVKRRIFLEKWIKT